MAEEHQQIYTSALDIAYEKDYEIQDRSFDEPFIVFKAIGTGRPAWWNGPLGREKVQNLIKGIKLDMTMDEAFIYAGITRAKYTYFCSIHRTFSSIKDRLEKNLGIAAKLAVAQHIVDGEDVRPSQWFLERRQPHIYGRDISAYTPVPEEATKKISAEAFLDDEGNVLVSRQTAERLKKEQPDGDGQTGT